MSEINDLSSDVRRCLWQCYELLLRLADEEEEATGETESSENDTSAMTTETNEIISLDVEQGPIKSEKQS